MTIGRAAGLVACMVAVGAVRPAAQNPPPAQNPPAAQVQTGSTQQPVFRAGIDSVLVDVRVTDKDGRPITDLTQQDFEIKENNKPQAIDTFKLIQLDDSPIDPASLPSINSFEDQEHEIEKDDSRLIVIFLDDYHTRRDNAQVMREKLARFVTNDLHPRDLVAIMYPLLPVSALTFSRSRSELAAQIMAFEGRKYDYTPKNEVDSRMAMDPPELIEQERNNIVITAIQTLCAYLGTVRDARKTVLYVSEGLTGSTPSSNVFGRSATPVTGANLMSQFQDIFADAARGNTALYTVDPRGLAVNEFGSTRNVNPQQDAALLNEAIDSLRVLADNTGGRAIIGSNDPIPGLKQMLVDSSSYYLLSYTSTEKYRDGRFHPIKVSVTRKGVKDSDVHAKKGYWAYSADEVTKMTTPAKPAPPHNITDALEALTDTNRGRPVRIWMGAARADDGKDAVTLAWEAVPSSSGDSLGPVDHVTVTATSVSGDELFSGPVARDPQSPEVAGRVTFDAKPGTISIKAVAETAKGLRLDTDDADLEAPDFTSVGVFITRPMVYRASTARDVQRIRTAATPPVPAVTREFLRSERLLIRFQAYAPGDAKPVVTARLLNQLGDPVADLAAPASTGGPNFEMDFGLGTLAPADYIIEITASSGETQKKTLLPIRVGS